jgi:hypothetical protein
MYRFFYEDFGTLGSPDVPLLGDMFLKALLLFSLELERLLLLYLRSLVYDPFKGLTLCLIGSYSYNNFYGDWL